MQHSVPCPDSRKPGEQRPGTEVRMGTGTKNGSDMMTGKPMLLIEAKSVSASEGKRSTLGPDDIFGTDRDVVWSSASGGFPPDRLGEITGSAAPICFSDISRYERRAVIRRASSASAQS